MNAQLVRSAKRAKWRVTSQWVSYDAARAEHLDSFPDYFNKVSSVYSPFLKPLCLFRQKMSLHVEVLGLSGGRSRWRKHIRFFSPLLSIQPLFSTRVAFGFSLQPSVSGEIEKREIRGLLTRRKGYPTKRVNPSKRVKDSPGLKPQFH